MFRGWVHVKGSGSCLGFGFMFRVCVHVYGVWVISC